MSRYTIIADIAGRRSLAIEGSDRMTAAAVSIHTSVTARFRDRIQKLPKWRNCTTADAEFAIETLAHSASVAIVSMTKDAEHWPRFWEAAKHLQKAIVSEAGKGSDSFAKPANVAMFALLINAYAIALGHAIRVSRGTRLLSQEGLELVERTIICDSDIQGAENVSLFESLFLRESDNYQPLEAEAGFRITTRSVIVATEEDEPLLLLADYAAGVGHSAHIPDPGRNPLPISHHEANRLLRQLEDAGKLVVLETPFDVDYAAVFGEAYLLALERQQPFSTNASTPGKSLKR